MEASFSGPELARYRGCLLFCTALTVLSLSTRASAQTTWTGAATPDWSANGNWTNNAPTAATPTTLGGAGGFNQPTQSANSAVGSLTMNGTGNTLNLSGLTLSSASSVNLSAGTIAGGGTVSAANSFIMSGGSVASGVTVSAAAATFTGGTLAEAILSATGQVDVQAGTPVTTTGELNSGTSIVNGAGGVLNARGILSAPTVTNLGTLNVTGTLSGVGAAGPNVAPIATFNNQGTGTLSIITGTFSGITNFNNTGSVTNNSTGTLQSGSYTQTGTGTTTNDGTLTISGALTVDGGTLTNNGTGTVAAATISNAATVTNSGTMGIAGATMFTNTGTVTNNGTGVLQGASFTQNGTGTTTNNGTLTMSGALTVNGGTFTNNASGTVAAATILNAAGATLTTSGTVTATSGASNSFINQGAVTASGGQINGGISNAAGGTFNVVGTVVGNSTFTNAAAGTLTVNAGSSYAPATLANAGTVTNGGSLGNAGVTTFTNTGTVTNNGTGTLQGAGYTQNGAVATTTNNGTLTMSGALTVNGGAFINNATGTVGVATISNAATVTNNGALGTSGVTDFTNTGSVSSNAGGALRGARYTQNGAATTTNSGTLTMSGVLTINGGTFTNNATGTATAATISNAATVTNNGTMGAAAVTAFTNTASFTNNAGATLRGASFTQNGVAAATANDGALTLSAALTVNGGNFTNTANGTISAATISNAADATVTVTGGSVDTTSGFSNSGTVAASGGQINGPIVNSASGLFSLTGTVTSTTTTFTNDGRLVVDNTGDYTISGNLNNNSQLTVNTGGVLSVNNGNLNNAASATILNNGTINDALNNAGTVDNNGNYNADVATNTGTINNNSTGNWTGNVTSSSGTINNAVGGIWTGGAASSGVINNSGTWVAGIAGITNSGIFNQAPTGTVTGAGGFTNNNVANIAGGSIVGPVNNNGAFNLNGNLTGVTVFSNNAAGTLNYAGSPTLSTASFVNNGAISTGAAGNRLTMTGSLSGNGTINAVANGNTTSSVVVQGASSGTQTINFNNGGPANPVFSSPATVLDLNGGTLAVANTGLVRNLSSGLLNNFLVQNGAGSDAYLQTIFNNGPISGVAGGVSSVITALTSGFFQAASAIVSRPADPEPDQVAWGPFIRVSVGDATTKLASTTSAFGTSSGSTTWGNTVFSGFQAGFDVGAYNISSSGWNVNVGFFGGVATTSSSANTVSPLPSGVSTTNTTVSMDVPYLALYGFVSRNSFTAEVNVRRDFYNGTVASSSSDATVGNGYLVSPNTPLRGRGLSVNANMANRFDVSDNLYLEPLIGMTYGQYSFDDVYFNSSLAAVGTSGRMNFSAIDSWMGRVGLNLGGTFLVTENIMIAPFAHGSVWREFAGPSSATAIVNSGGSSFNFGVTTDRVGTFGQFGAGLQFKIIDLDVLGFLRGDLRFGENIDGKALNMGLRKQF